MLVLHTCWFEFQTPTVQISDKLLHQLATCVDWCRLGQTQQDCESHRETCLPVVSPLIVQQSLASEPTCIRATPCDTPVLLRQEDRKGLKGGNNPKKYWKYTKGKMTREHEKLNTQGWQDTGGTNQGEENNQTRNKQEVQDSRRRTTFLTSLWVILRVYCIHSIFIVYVLLGFYLCCIIGAALVVGQLEFAERHFLSHPVSPRVRRVWVHIHPVPWKHTISST